MQVNDPAFANQLIAIPIDQADPFCVGPKLCSGSITFLNSGLHDAPKGLAPQHSVSNLADPLGSSTVELFFKIVFLQVFPRPVIIAVALSDNIIPYDG